MWAFGPPERRRSNGLPRAIEYEKKGEKEGGKCYRMLDYPRQLLHGLVAPVTELKTSLRVLLMLAVGLRDGARDCYPREVPQSREVTDRPISTPLSLGCAESVGSVLVRGRTRRRRWIETLS